MEPALQIIGTMLGYLVAVLVRHLSRRRFWHSVQQNAQRLLADPQIPIDDATIAAERALLEAQASRVASVARTIRKSDPPPVVSNLIDRPFTRYHLRKGKPRDD